LADTTAFYTVLKQHMKTLTQYVPIVARVHGNNHPEFHEVDKLFDLIREKTKGKRSVLPELSEEFAALRKITSNYSIPQDVCESYEAVYTMLAELDKAYHQ